MSSGYQINNDRATYLGPENLGEDLGGLDMIHIDDSLIVGCMAISAQKSQTIPTSSGSENHDESEPATQD